MTRRVPKPITDVNAMAFFNFAREYHSAANQLFDSRSFLRNPIYFLYFHTVELALKAFLRSLNMQVLGTQRQSHSLTKLYEESRRLGLTVGPADRFGIGNIVTLLEAGNEYQGFRYFNLKSGSLPSLSWTREVVEQLMLAVETHLEGRTKLDTVAAAPAKLTIIYGKPARKVGTNVRLDDSKKS
jgi:hypothetical protein